MDGTPARNGLRAVITRRQYSMSDETPKHPGSENLISADKRSEEELREMTRRGGIKSGEVRREKRKMADLYAMVLAKKYKVTVDGKEETLSGYRMIGNIIGKIVQREDSAAVSMIKELREGIDGSRIGLNGNDGAPFVFKMEIVPAKKEGE